VLLHGYAETRHMWLPIMPLLAKNHTVIVPTFGGAGDSSNPIRLRQEKYGRGHPRPHVEAGISIARIVGHDIGLMVAYAYAAQIRRRPSVWF